LVILIAEMRFTIEREQAQANKDRLQSALDAAKLGSWQYYPLHVVFSWDGRGREIFAVAENAATVEEFMNGVHPDDVEKVWVAYHRALDPAQAERSPTQFRLRRGDGRVGWVETEGLAHLEGAGRGRRVVTFIGSLRCEGARRAFSPLALASLVLGSRRSETSLCEIDSGELARVRRGHEAHSRATRGR
jgi:PAS domain-containing protein